MKKHPLLRTALLVMTAAALLCVSALAVEDGAPTNSMYGTFWALVPPVIAITLALITKEAYSSLFIGVTVGALFSQGFSPIGALNMIVNDGLVAAIKDNAGIFLFLVLLGIIVALVNAAGGSAAFGRWASQNIKTKVGASLATFVLGILIFIDDYFNCLTVGTVMRPVTDSHRISRPKLAYLIDATAAPVCMIAPISSWAAAVSSTAEGLDTGISGIQLFIKAIPYNLYSLLTFVFIIALSFMQFDYGSMRTYERKAQETGDLSALENAEDEAVNPKGKVIDLLLPGAGADRHLHHRHDLCGRLLRRGRLGRHRLRRRLHRRLRQYRRLHGSALGRHHRSALHRHLSGGPPGHHLQGRHGLHPQGLQRHDLPHPDPDPRRLSEGYHHLSGRQHLCP